MLAGFTPSEEIALVIRGARTGMTKHQRELAEKRRLLALEDIKEIEAGRKTVKEVALKFGVYKTTIASWIRRAKEDKIKSQKSDGAPPGKITTKQRAQIEKIYRGGVKAAGFENCKKWNSAILVKVIEQRFHVVCTEAAAKRMMYRWDPKGALRTSHRPPSAGLKPISTQIPTA